MKTAVAEMVVAIFESNIGLTRSSRMRRCGDAEMRRCGDAEMRRCGDAEMLANIQ
jgi:hypothetical protein